MGDKTTHLLLGVFVGGIVVGGFFYMRNKKTISNYKKAAVDSHEAGYVEAHENFEKLLDWAQEKRASPLYVKKVIRGEVEV